MPKFHITSPDGSEYEIDAPEGATEEQAVSYLQQQDQAQQVQATPQIVDGAIMPPGIDRGAGRAGLQGFNSAVPFGQRITAGLGALGASALTGEPVSDLYNEARQDQAATNQANPDSALAGSLVGIAGTLPLASARVLSGAASTTGVRGAVNAIPQALSQVGNFVRGTKAAEGAGTLAKAGNIALRSGRGGLVGIPASTLYAYGDAPEGERVDAALSGAGLGAIIGSAAPAAGAVLGKLNTKTIVPAADEIKALASKAYQTAEARGGILKPNITNEFIDSIETIKPQTEIGRAVGGDNVVTQLSQRLQGIKDKPMSLQAAQEVDELLGDFIDAEFKEGRLSKQGTKLLDIQGKLRDTIENAPEEAIIGGKEGFDSLKDGRRLYAASRRMNDVERIINRADDYQVPATAIKTGFRTLKNSARFRGYSPEEKAAIERASRTGVVTDLLSVFGSRLGPLAGAAAGSAGGPLGAAAGGLATYAGSSIARKGASALQKGRADAVTRAISDRAGLTTTQQRISLQQLLKLPPSQALQILGDQQ